MIRWRKKQAPLYLQSVCIGKSLFLFVFVQSNKLSNLFDLFFRVVSISMVFINKYLLSSKELKVTLFICKTSPISNSINLQLLFLFSNSSMHQFLSRGINVWRHSQYALFCRLFPNKIPKCSRIRVSKSSFV